MFILFGSFMGLPLFFRKLEDNIAFYDEVDLASLNVHIDKVPPWLIYVFGSNRKGIHGLGAALYARNNFGARIGQGAGFQGRSYGIPTKNMPRDNGLPIKDIAVEVEEFCKFTHEHKEFTYLITAVGTGLAGHRNDDIAPLFKNAINCWFPIRWINMIYNL